MAVLVLEDVAAKSALRSGSSLNPFCVHAGSMLTRLLGSDLPRPAGNERMLINSPRSATTEAQLVSATAHCRGLMVGQSADSISISEDGARVAVRLEDDWSGRLVNHPQISTLAQKNSGQSVQTQSSIFK